MKIMLNPNCSEAVFRFHTGDPKQMQFILQSIADEISKNTGFEPHKNQNVPLLEKAEMYDSEKSLLTATKLTGISLLEACAGLGDNSAEIRVNTRKKFFTLNIGNNDISENKTNWVESIKSLGIQVEEAECDESLRKIARDCTCSIVYGFQEKK